MNKNQRNDTESVICDECLNDDLQIMGSALDIISRKMSSFSNEELIRFECVCIQIDIMNGILRVAYTPNRKL